MMMTMRNIVDEDDDDDGGGVRVVAIAIPFFSSLPSFGS